MTDFRDHPDLANERLGGAVLYATDDFFAEKENLLKPQKPVWKEHEYTDRGKWMDGWESRRKRTPGHDFCVARLGFRGVVRGVVVDTSYFRGNYPDHCLIEACDAPPETSIESLLSSADWFEVLGKSKLEGDKENLFKIEAPYAVTHLRFHIFPDGGVARLRVHGEPVVDWRRAGGLDREVDLAAIEHGGDVLSCSDMFFGPKHNLIMPGRALNMSDGWETKRRRGPGHDWVIVKLATEGVIRRIEIDTNHFKGNYPDTCSIEASNLPTGQELSRAEWLELLPRATLQGHTRHLFIDELTSTRPATHLRLNVYPDGGVSRMRVFGVATAEGRRAEVVRRLNTLHDPDADLAACCGSAGWSRAMRKSRPFSTWEDLAKTADRIWQGLSNDDWLEAFRSHPRIGESKSASQGPAANRWSKGEQAKATSSAEETRRRLADANREYEEKFGHIFIVCASGRSGEEILAILRRRLQSTPEEALREAAEEQKKITMLRLERLVSV